jgi:hypothetical protein
VRGFSFQEKTNEEVFARALSAPEEGAACNRGAHRFFWLLEKLPSGIALLIAGGAGAWLLKVYQFVAQGNPYRAGVFALFGLVALVAIIAGITALGRQLLQRRKFNLILEGCGIKGWWERKTPEEVAESWNYCTEKLLQQGSKQIFIGGMTGARTFACAAGPGKQEAPLRNALIKHRGEIRILLVNRNSRVFEERVKELAEASDRDIEELALEMTNELRESLQFCRTLGAGASSQHKSIELRVFNVAPIFKIVLFGDYLWLKHYRPDNHVEDTSACFITNDPPDKRGSSLYRPFELVFDKRWAREEGQVLYRKEGSQAAEDPTLNNPSHALSLDRPLLWVPSQRGGG